MAERIHAILCEPREESSTLLQPLLAALRSRGDVAATVLPHLYDLDAEGPGMRHLRSLAGNLIVLAALYPRAAYWVLDANGVKGRMGRTAFMAEEEAETPDDRQKGERTIWCLDPRGHDEPGALLAEIDRIVTESTGRAPALAGDAQSDGNGEARIEEMTSARWYPVIDYGRCTNCLECLDFCLFGVFGVDESGALMAEEPDACRQGCPACARVCPSQAIMFPRHDNPAIAGQSGASSSDFNLDLVQLLGGLDPQQLAAAEREKCVKEKDELDRLVDELDEMDL
jgi:NAD-dependent dihydropyrimidine dehydrogenase PreA subunit